MRRKDNTFIKMFLLEFISNFANDNQSVQSF